MARSKARIFTRKFKLAAVNRMQGGADVSALARTLRVRRKLLYEWREHYRSGGPEALRGRGRPSKAAPARAAAADELTAARARIAELERKVGQQALDLDFFQQALRQVGEARQPSDGLGVPASTRSSRR
jgi:transposase